MCGVCLESLGLGIYFLFQCVLFVVHVLAEIIGAVVAKATLQAALQKMSKVTLWARARWKTLLWLSATFTALLCILGVWGVVCFFSSDRGRIHLSGEALRYRSLVQAVENGKSNAVVKGLVKAAKRGQPTQVNFYVSRLEPGGFFYSTSSLLFVAVEACDDQIVSSLLEHGADPNLGWSVGPFGLGASRSPLFEAIDRQCDEVVRILVAGGADVTGRAASIGPFGLFLSMSPLYWAVHRHDRLSATTLLDAGASGTASSYQAGLWGFTSTDSALNLAVTMLDEHLVALILARNGADAATTRGPFGLVHRSPPVFSAVATCAPHMEEAVVAVVETFARFNVDLNNGHEWVGPFGLVRSRSPLYAAVEANCKGVVEALLRLGAQGADPAGLSYGGGVVLTRSALYAAVVHNNAPMSLAFVDVTSTTQLVSPHSIGQNIGPMGWIFSSSPMYCAQYYEYDNIARMFDFSRDSDDHVLWTLGMWGTPFYLSARQPEQHSRQAERQPWFAEQSSLASHYFVGDCSLFCISLHSLASVYANATCEIGAQPCTVLQCFGAGCLPIQLSGVGAAAFAGVYFGVTWLYLLNELRHILPFCSRKRHVTPRRLYVLVTFLGVWAVAKTSPSYLPVVAYAVAAIFCASKFSFFSIAAVCVTLSSIDLHFAGNAIHDVVPMSSAAAALWTFLAIRRRPCFRRHKRWWSAALLSVVALAVSVSVMHSRRTVDVDEPTVNIPVGPCTQQIPFLNSTELQSDFETMTNRKRGMRNAKHVDLWHGIFGTQAENCTMRQLNRQWKLTMIRYHPDKFLGSPECAQIASLWLNAAFELLQLRGKCSE